MSPRERNERQSILVVDDEPGIVDVLTAVLEDAGYQVAGAANGQEALQKLDAAPPDLMLLDFEMPLLDGADTLRALRVRGSRASFPVVMMSGVPESMVQRRCRGYRAFLRKPFSLEDLLATVAQILTNTPDGTRRRPPQRARAHKKRRGGG